ncbi:hypothetical protein QFC21_007146 [Naganishia friedmannii]|uniref:Uncharacterized protein n=1 Tax=Naganishia friedmannii TaxID=89922 RepID=A0ACC2UYB5_9TREE|nr:hypothetical protein QFC21_007146 [Naganishia friedmannii]
MDIAGPLLLPVGFRSAPCGYLSCNGHGWNSDERTAARIHPRTHIKLWCSRQVLSAVPPEETFTWISYNVTPSLATTDGVARLIYTINGQTPGPLLQATQGETFVITVVNKLPLSVGMHWHGLHQRGTPEFDGVPGLNQYGIPPGGNLTYRFGTTDNYGAYWYHVHVRDVYQDGLRGPLLIHPSDDVERPYHLISNDTADVEAFTQAEKEAPVLMVNDWFHQTSETMLARLSVTNDAMAPLCANSVLFNGMGRVICSQASDNTTSFGCNSMSMDMSLSSMNMSKSSTMDTGMAKPMVSSSSMNMPSASMVSSSERVAQIAEYAQMGAMTAMSTAYTSSQIQVSTVQSAYSSQPSQQNMANDVDKCQDTDTPLYHLTADGNSTWFMFHLVNAGAAQELGFSIDEHDMWVIAADGAYVRPVRAQVAPDSYLGQFPLLFLSQVLNIGIGQRYGIMIQRPSSARNTNSYTIRAVTRTHQAYEGRAYLTYGNTSANASAVDAPWMSVNGSFPNSQTTLLDPAKLPPYPLQDLPQATRQLWLDVNQTEPTVWVLHRVPFQDNNNQVLPLLFAPRLDPGVFSISESAPEVIDVVMQIAPDSLDAMAHPIHLHGHYFRVLGSKANSLFPSNLTVDEVKDRMRDSDIAAALDLSNTAPQRDTAHLPENGWLAIRFTANNPGVWLLHCHINSHLSSGMAIAFMEMRNNFSSFDAAVTMVPVIAPLPPLVEA